MMPSLMSWSYTQRKCDANMISQAVFWSNMVLKAAEKRAPAGEWGVGSWCRQNNDFRSGKPKKDQLKYSSEKTAWNCFIKNQTKYGFTKDWPQKLKIPSLPAVCLSPDSPSVPSALLVFCAMPSNMTSFLQGVTPITAVLVCDGGPRYKHVRKIHGGGGRHKWKWHLFLLCVPSSKRLFGCGGYGDMFVGEKEGLWGPFIMCLMRKATYSRASILYGCLEERVCMCMSVYMHVGVHSGVWGEHR